MLTNLSNSDEECRWNVENVWEMVEVTLSVEGGGVYIVGQTIKCALLVHNSSDVADRLAWATGQISGHVT